MLLGSRRFFSCGFDNLYLYADDNLRYLSETSHLFNYLKAGINLGFTKDVGFGLEYSYGNDAPKFLKEQMLNASLTLKFWQRSDPSSGSDQVSTGSERI